MMKQPFVVAVIPTFNPDEQFVKNVSLIEPQVDMVVIVDDGSNDKQYLGSFNDEKTTVHLIENDENQGIAYVLNQGIRYGLEKGATHIVTFDQDSTVEGGYITRLLEAETEAKEQGIKVGTVAPHTIGQELNGRDFISINSKISTCRYPVQSGLLIQRHIFEEIGYFDEGLVIDWVEFDFQYRLAEAGYKNVIAISLHLAHQVGDNIDTDSHTFSSHSPLRYYYISRNSYLVKTKYEKDKVSNLSGLGYGFGHMLKDAKNSSDGKEKIKLFLQGKLDGIRGIKGKKNSK
ncbi:MAG: glycosyltransferase [Micrococcaceae bacterium]